MFGILAPRSYQPRRNAQGWSTTEILRMLARGTRTSPCTASTLSGRLKVDGHVCTVNGDTHRTGSQSSGYQTADQAHHTHTAAMTISILTRRFMIGSLCSQHPPRVALTSKSGHVPTVAHHSRNWAVHKAAISRPLWPRTHRLPPRRLDPVTQLAAPANHARLAVRR
jgi:hypothetical protein